MSKTSPTKIGALTAKTRTRAKTRIPTTEVQPIHERLPIAQHLPTTQQHQPVSELLRERILELPFDAYARLIALLLERLGYEKVIQAGRTDWKGRNHSGGIDLIASLPGGLTPRRVVIQIKQFDRDSRVFQRHIDELCGVAIRSRASEALLITTGPVSSSIHFDSLVSPLLPIRLVAGDQLMALLVQHGVGVTKEGALDVALLDRLTRTAKGNSREDCRDNREDCPGRPEVFVTVEMVSRSKRRQISRLFTRA